MRRLFACLTLLAAPTSALAGEPFFDRLENDLQKLAYCVGFWGSVDTAKDYGLDHGLLAYDPAEKREIARAALGKIHDPYSKAGNHAERLTVNAQVMFHLSAGTIETQDALRHAMRNNDMAIQVVANKLIDLIQPVCAEAALSSDTQND